MKHWKILLMFLLFGLMSCESDADRIKRIVLEQRLWEPSTWVKEWVEKEYNPPRCNKPKIDNPKIETTRDMYKEETALQFLRNTIRPGKNVWECETKIIKKMGSSVKFNLLNQRETRSHIYGLWSVTVLGQPALRLFTVNGIIESITEHPGLR